MLRPLARCDGEFDGRERKPYPMAAITTGGERALIVSQCPVFATVTQRCSHTRCGGAQALRSANG